MMKQRVMKRAKKKRTEIKAGSTLAPLGTVKKSNYYITVIYLQKTKKIYHCSKYLTDQ